MYEDKKTFCTACKAELDSSGGWFVFYWTHVSADGRIAKIEHITHEHCFKPLLQDLRRTTEAVKPEVLNTGGVYAVGA